MGRLIIAAGISLLAFGCSGSSRTAEQAPLGFVAVPSGPGCVSLTWDGSSAEVVSASIVIERRGSTSGFVAVANLATGVARFTDTGLQPSTTYIYRLRSIVGGAPAAALTEASVRTADPGFAVFARPNGSGGDDLFFASGDGSVPPSLVRANGEQALQWIEQGLVGSRRNVVFGVAPPLVTNEVEIWVRPMDCGIDSVSKRVAVAADLASLGIVADRYLVLTSADAAGARLLAVDLETDDVRVLLESNGGAIRAYPQTPFDGANEIVATVAAGANQTDSIAYFVDVTGTRSPEELFREPGGSVAVINDSYGRTSIQRRTCVLEWCSDDSCRTRRRFLVRADDPVRHELRTSTSFSLLSAPDQVRVTDDFIVWRDLGMQSPTGGFGSDLYSIATQSGSKRRLTAMPAGDTVDWDDAMSGGITTFVHSRFGSPAVGLFSVSVDGTAQPVELAAPGLAIGGPLEFTQRTLFDGYAFYRRQAQPNAMMVAELGVAGSERALPIEGSARIARPGGDPLATTVSSSATEAMIVTSNVLIGGVSYSDVWSVRPDGLGAIETVRMSDHVDIRTPALAGLRVTVVNARLKDGRVIYYRGGDLFSSEIGVASSERQLTSDLPGLVESPYCATGPDPHMFFWSGGQVWSVLVDGSRPAAQLIDLPGDAVTVDFHGVDESGRLWFSSIGVATNQLFAAVPGKPGSATAVSTGVVISDRFQFMF